MKTTMRPYQTEADYSYTSLRQHTLQAVPLDRSKERTVFNGKLHR